MDLVSLFCQKFLDHFLYIFRVTVFPPSYVIRMVIRAVSAYRDDPMRKIAKLNKKSEIGNDPKKESRKKSTEGGRAVSRQKNQKGKGYWGLVCFAGRFSCMSWDSQSHPNQK